MNEQFLYDLEWKLGTLKNTLEEMKKRRDWQLFPFSGVRPPEQDGVVIEGGRTRVNGEAKMRWSAETIGLAESYVTCVTSFFDILAKAFSRTWTQGQNLYFKTWIDGIFSQNPSDEFVKDLHDFKVNWLQPLSNVRNSTAHERTLAREIKSFFHLKGEKGGKIVVKTLTFEQDGQEKELVDYLEEFDKELSKLIEKINNNKQKSY